MRKVRCHDCGKTYDFDVDDFCPKCGAFTQPKRERLMNVNCGSSHKDGINEQNHKKSFLHEEYHGENRARKKTALEKNLVPVKKAHEGVRLKPRGEAAGNIALDAVGEAVEVFFDWLDSV